MWMQRETKIALEQSIAKWQRNYEAHYIEDITFGASDCPLCVLYRTPSGNSHEISCRGCPVRLSGGDDVYTSRHNCCNTPYEDVIECLDDITYVEGATVPDRLRMYIKAELDFLKSLLP